MSYNGVPNSEAGFGEGQPGSQPQGSPEPKWFRDRMEQLAQANKALSDQVKALTEKDRQAALAEQFAKAGVNPAAAALYPGEPDKVGEWLEAHKALLAPAQAQQQQTGDAGQQAAGSAIPPAQQAAMQQMQAAGSGLGVQPPQGSQDELAAALLATSNPDDFTKVAQAAGWQYTRDNLTF
jgi:hypothetical protein